MGVLVRNSGTADLTVDPAGSETVNGGATVTLNPGFSAELFNTGAGWTALLAAPQNFGRIVGELIPIAGTSLPPLCVWPNGQNLSRSAYAALFAALGTTYGVGDGTTTFGTPDLRGRALFGRDNLGGTAASRVTVAQSGIAGTTLGAGGGSELLHLHGHGITDPTHAHDVWTDAQGTHQHLAGNPNSGGGSYFGLAYGGSAIGGDRDALIGGRLDENTYLTNSAGSHSHNVGITARGTGITVNTNGSGNSQNMPPALICNYVLFAGV
ncbi:MAG: phage tail protein [Acetobacteraceae bacterium]|nr:phage tail protein [Acetobacteraceae bacterium]